MSTDESKPESWWLKPSRYPQVKRELGLSESRIVWERTHDFRGPTHPTITERRLGPAPSEDWDPSTDDYERVRSKLDLEFDDLR